MRQCASRTHSQFIGTFGGLGVGGGAQEVKDQKSSCCNHCISSILYIVEKQTLIEKKSIDAEYEDEKESRIRYVVYFICLSKLAPRILDKSKLFPILTY